MASAPEPEENKEVAPLHQYPVITPCDLCETKEDVYSFCRNCSQNLCDVCKRLHLRSTVSRDHVVVHISEGKSSGSEATACALHGERLFFYCRKCSVLFCPKCLNPSHKTHDFLDTDEYAKEMQSRVAAMIEERSNRVKESRLNSQQIEDGKEIFVEGITKCKASVIDTAKHLHGEVDRVQAEILSTISCCESQGLIKFDEAKLQEKYIETELQETLGKLIHHSKKHDNISLIGFASKLPDDCKEKDGSLTAAHDLKSEEPEQNNSLLVRIVEFGKSSNIPDNAIQKLFGILSFKDINFLRKIKHAETSKKLKDCEKQEHHESSLSKESKTAYRPKSSEFCFCDHSNTASIIMYASHRMNQCLLCKKPLR